MNFAPFSSPAGRLAKLYYAPGSYRVLSSGDHVLCGRSGAVIPLDALRYWCPDRQEAYATAAIAVEAITGRQPVDES